MELIPYSQFAKLRLRHLFPDAPDVSEMDGYEWLGGYGINEGCRGADFFRWEETPEETTGIELFSDLLAGERAEAILEAIKLPVRFGMMSDQVNAVLGKPEKRDIFGDHLKDRQTDEFTIGSEHLYHVCTTVHEETGLIALAIVRSDLLSKIEAKEAAFQAEIRAAQTS
jgi:hypothetical protein